MSSTFSSFLSSPLVILVRRQQRRRILINPPHHSPSSFVTTTITITVPLMMNRYLCWCDCVCVCVCMWSNVSISSCTVSMLGSGGNCNVQYYYINFFGMKDTVLFIFMWPLWHSLSGCPPDSVNLTGKKKRKKSVRSSYGIVFCREWHHITVLLFMLIHSIGVSPDRQMTKKAWEIGPFVARYCVLVKIVLIFVLRRIDLQGVRWRKTLLSIVRSKSLYVCPIEMKIYSKGCVCTVHTFVGRMQSKSIILGRICLYLCPFQKNLTKFFVGCVCTFVPQQQITMYVLRRLRLHVCPPRRNGKKTPKDEPVRLSDRRPNQIVVRIHRALPYPPFCHAIKEQHASKQS